MNTPVKKKHPQFILAMDQRYFDERPEFNGVTAYPRVNWQDEVQEHLVIRERAWLDASHKGKGDRRYRQILPYVICAIIGDDGQLKYVPYRRLPGGGEDKLANNVSIGFGGHIDLDDVKRNQPKDERDETSVSTVNLGLTTYYAALREVYEEVEFRDFDHEIVKGDRLASLLQPTDLFIVDNSNDVGLLHMATIVRVVLPSTFSARCKEEQLETLRPMTARELLDSGLKLENWTRLYLEHVTADQPVAA